MVAPGINRRIRLKVYVDNGKMYYKVGLNCMNGDNKEKGCDKPFERRRLLQSGAMGC